MKPDSITYKEFVADIKTRIRESQYRALKKVNKELISLYWDIGKMIHHKQQKLGWSQAVVEQLSHELQNDFPGMSGFSTRNLWLMRQFFATYTNNENLQQMVAEIGWSNNILILSKCTIIWHVSSTSE